LYDFAADNPVDVEGRSARKVCSPETTRGNPPREIFIVHLREAIEE